MKDDRPYFRAQGVTDELGVRYAAWVDLMGTSSMMQRSATIAAAFIGKLHGAAIKATSNVSDDHVRLYPVVDGVYITASAQAPLLRVLKQMMRSLAVNFVLEKDVVHRFMVRGAIAYGPMCEGKDLLTPENWQLASRPDYAKSICLGTPLTQAFESEKAASPYGIWVHESARTFAPAGNQPLAGTQWHWWKYRTEPSDLPLVECLHSQLIDYLDWCERHSARLIYDEERIDQHRRMVSQYFTTTLDDPFLLSADAVADDSAVAAPAVGVALHAPAAMLTHEPAGHGSGRAAGANPLPA